MELSRRALLTGAVGLTVAGWDPRSRSWVAEAAGGCTPGDVQALRVDGLLLLDPLSRSAAADDYGHVVHEEPVAVLRPAHARDVVTAVRYARQHGLDVVARGTGGSAYGQAQSAGALVVDLTSLARVLEIGKDRMVVEAGVLWRTVLATALAVDLTPPVSTDYLDLTVGGTLSLGGLDSGPMEHGAQVDNVLEMQVVTGSGELLSCSRTVRPDLFDAVLAGLGQVAVVVRATLALVPAPPTAVLVHLHYDDAGALLDDVEVLLADRRFQSFDALATWQVDHWTFELQALAPSGPPVPDTAALGRGLHDVAALRTATTVPYAAWFSRYDALFTAARTLGLGKRPAEGSVVVSNVLVPLATGAALVRDLFGPALVGAIGPSGRVLLVASDDAHVRAPLLRLPAGPAVSVLMAKIPSDVAQRDAFLADNRRLHDRVRALGGSRYPWDALPGTSSEDWRAHYGDAWHDFARAKRRWDPDGVLGAGVGIFPRRTCRARP